MIYLNSVGIEAGSNTQHPFEDVIFDKGINFIIGDKSSDEEKMNGVGKSVLIEMIDYGLLSDYTGGRIQKIPTSILDNESRIIATFTYSDGKNETVIVVKRGVREKANEVHIQVGEDDDIKLGLDQARKFMEKYFIAKRTATTPSLRGLLAILLRKENALYDDVFYPTPSSKSARFIDNVKPHLYIFGVDLALVDSLKTETLRLKNAKVTIDAIEASLKESEIPLKELKSYIFDLEAQTRKLDLSVEALKPAEATTIKKEQLTEYLVELDKLTTQRASLMFELKRLNDVPKTKKLNTKSLKETYNYYSQGLGDKLNASFDEVQAFRASIEKFQNDLILNKQEEITKKVTELTRRVGNLDNLIAEIYEFTDARRKIDDLTDAVVKLKSSNEQLEKLRAFFELHEARSKELVTAKESVDETLRELSRQMENLASTVGSFEADLRQMHNYIAGNERCQFGLSVDFDKPLTKFIDMNYRIKLDGSSGINRIKTFIYDVLLMTNSYTSVNHPKILIHDNIFASSGRDDMVKSLNYLNKFQESMIDFQYIVTINRDEFGAVEDRFDFDFEDKVKISLTRDNPLFGVEYSQSIDPS